MDRRAIPRILRIEGLIPFTGCAVLLGLFVSVHEAGLSGTDWVLFCVAAAVAFLIHIDAHIWNDIMDLDTDRREKSRETGRDRPLLLGWATAGEYRALSAGVVALVLLLAGFLTLQRPLMPILLALGLFFDYGYNHPRIALAYRPFTEFYIFPWLVVGVTVTVVYAATGAFSPSAFILAFLLGLVSTCFVVSMMRRDAVSDRLGGKQTSSVRYPGLPHATIYAVITLAAAALAFFPLARALGDPRPALAFVLTTAVVAITDTALGVRIDRLTARAMRTDFPAFEGLANRLMLLQVNAALAGAGIFCIILLAAGRIAH